MKRRYAHLPRTALALLAAAGTVWLAAFFLPGAVVEPIPLLPSIGGSAAKVVEAPGVRARKRVAHHRTTAILAVAHPSLPTATAAPPVTTVTRVRRAVRRAQHAHPRRHAPRPTHSAPVQKAAPAQAPASTSAGPVFYGNAPSGRAVGWHRKHDQATAPASAPPSVRGHGNGHGNGHGKHDAPPVQPAPTPIAPVAPPSAGTDGHDNGKHLGDQHDHGDQGEGPGGKK